MGHLLRIHLSDDDFAPLQRLAEQRRQPPEEVAQELLTQAVIVSLADVDADPRQSDVPQVSQEVGEDPFWSVVGITKTGCPGWGSRHDEILGDALIEELRGGRRVD